MQKACTEKDIEKRCLLQFRLSDRNETVGLNAPVQSKKRRVSLTEVPMEITDRPIIAARNSMCLESISRIKKIKLHEDSDVTIYENPRSCNGVIKSWCISK